MLANYLTIHITHPGPLPNTVNVDYFWITLYPPVSWHHTSPDCLAPIHTCTALTTRANKKLEPPLLSNLNQTAPRQPHYANAMLMLYTAPWVTKRADIQYREYPHVSSTRAPRDDKCHTIPYNNALLMGCTWERNSEKHRIYFWICIEGGWRLHPITVLNLSFLITWTWVNLSCQMSTQWYISNYIFLHLTLTQTGKLLVRSC